MNQARTWSVGIEDSNARHFKNFLLSLLGRPLSAQFSWAPQKQGLLLAKRVAALSEGTQWGKGGSGKAEDAKLQDAGISPKQWPKKRSGRKRLAYRTRQQSAWGGRLNINV